MKQHHILLLLFSLWSGKILAQISLNTSATASICSANGTISVQVIGGTPPYSYFLNGVPKDTLSSNTFIYTGLEPNSYQVKVKDASGATNTNNQIVGGDYIEPVLLAELVGCDVVAMPQNGLAPFLYAISATNGNYNNYQPNPVISNFPNNSYCYIRVKDACNNISTTSISVSEFVVSPFPICQAENDTMYTVTVDDITGGKAPYQVVCTDIAGAHTSTNGTFEHLKGCAYTLTITDACNRTFSNTYPSCLPLALYLDCIDCDRGDLSFSIAGGKQPSYTKIQADLSVTTTTNTSVSNLPTPSNGFYTVSYFDGCPQKIITKQFHCFNTQLQCTASPFDGRVTFDLKGNYKYGNPSYPMSVICLNCANHDTVVINNNNDLPIVFDGMMVGEQHFEIIDGCGTHFFRNSDCTIDWNIFMTTDTNGSGGGGGGSGGGTGGGGGTPTGQAICGTIMNVTIPLAGCTYNVFTLIPTTQLYSSNATGVFPNIPQDKYLVEIMSPTGFLLIRDTFDTRFYLQDLKVGCRGFTIGACPGPATLDLADGDGVLIYQNDVTGIYENLIPGENYILTATQLVAPFKTIIQEISLPFIGRLTYELKGCSELFCNLQYVATTYSPEAPTFTFAGDTGSYFMQNEDGHFTGLMQGLYTLTVTRGICDTIVKHIVIGGDLEVSPCMSLKSFTPTQTTWYFNTNIIGGTLETYTLLNDSGQVFSNPSTSANLVQGNYTLLSPFCALYNFSLPTFPLHPLQVEVTSVCANLGCIKASGGWDNARWAQWADSVGTVSCGMGDSYRLKHGSDVRVNSTGVFCDLKVGGTYTIYLLTNGFAIDSTDFFMPYYIQPNLTATIGALCDGANLGEIIAVAQGTGAPFTYQILNPPAGYSPSSIVSVNDSVTFSNLPTGVYNLMVYDNCGASSDFAAAVGGITFTPQWERFCNGSLWLKAPAYTNATYIWTDEAGNIVGPNANEIVVNGYPAGTFQVVIQFSGCASIGTVSVEPFTGILLNASAGNDEIYPFHAPMAFANLQGNTPPMGVYAHWEQVFPGSSPASIINATQADANIKVFNAGIYTFVWLWQSENCIVADTVVLTFANCLVSPEPVQVNTATHPETCKDNTQNGAAVAMIYGGVGPFTLQWNTGETTPLIQNLSQGTYTVTVTDLAGCFPSQDVATQEAIVSFVYEQPEAYFESTPSDMWDVIQGSLIHFNNMSKHATMYAWDFAGLSSSSDENPTFRFPEIGEYRVSLTAKTAVCQDRYSRIYKVIPYGTLFIANAFTPHNNDEHNSTFIPIGYGIVEMHFWVFNRWGNLIFETHDPNNAWDGTYKGEPCPEGVYTYRVTAKLLNDRVINQAGTVTLIR